MCTKKMIKAHSQVFKVQEWKKFKGSKLFTCNVNYSKLFYKFTLLILYYGITSKKQWMMCVGNSKQLTNNWPTFHSENLMFHVLSLLQPNLHFSDIFSLQSAQKLIYLFLKIYFFLKHCLNFVAFHKWVEYFKFTDFFLFCYCSKWLKLEEAKILPNYLN